MAVSMVNHLRGRPNEVDQRISLGLGYEAKTPKTADFVQRKAVCNGINLFQGIQEALVVSYTKSR